MDFSRNQTLSFAKNNKQETYQGYKIIQKELSSLPVVLRRWNVICFGQYDDVFTTPTIAMVRQITFIIESSFMHRWVIACVHLIILHGHCTLRWLYEYNFVETSCQCKQEVFEEKQFPLNKVPVAEKCYIIHKSITK